MVKHTFLGRNCSTNICDLKQFAYSWFLKYIRYTDVMPNNFLRTRGGRYGFYFMIFIIWKTSQREKILEILISLNCLWIEDGQQQKLLTASKMFTTEKKSFFC